MSNLFKRCCAFALTLVMMAGIVPGFVWTVLADDDDDAVVIRDFTSLVFDNLDAFLDDMGRGADGLPTGMPELTLHGFELFFNHESGAVAVRDQRTGQVLTTNPYDVGKTEGPTFNVKADLLSQVIIRYMDADMTLNFDSYRQAALNNQIRMRPIRGGIRVEYTLGRAEQRVLVPRMIPATSFRERIMAYVPEGRARQKLEAYYSFKCAQAPDLTERARRELQVKFPVTTRFAIYVFDPNASRRELNEIEGYIREFSSYTFEMMDEDHRETEFVGADRPPPLFRLAIEYYIEPDGLRVRLPANGIRFDESNYQIDSINLLPFMGAIRRDNIGYTFIPDGSGALVRSEDIGSTTFTFRNNLYGHDFSFFNITGGHATQRWVMPVFGAVEEHTVSRTFIDEIPEERIVPAVTEIQTVNIYDEDGEVIGEEEIEIELYPETTEIVYVEVERVEVEERRDGFLAIIEEGDAMARIGTDHAGSLHPFNSTQALFTPRPTDQYQLDTDATGLSSVITVASRRRYTGNFIIRYIMLSDNTAPSTFDPRAGAVNLGDRIVDRFEATWVGMAHAYRDYLQRHGVLTRRVGTGASDIPLFIETLGLMQTAENFLGFPYVGQTPLTTFDDVKSMIDRFNDEGIRNVNFRMRGWNNGGMNQSVPTRIRIHRNMGGADALRSLNAFAEERGATVFPDVEMTLVWNFGALNGFNYRRDLARSMSDQFSREQHYFFLFQTFMGRFSHNIVSPNRVGRIYDLSMRHFNNFNPHAISVASMTRELHSDQNRRNLVNRQEAQGYVTNVLARINEDHGRVLGMEANAFTWRYVDATLGLPLDASRMMNQSEPVPFIGMVTHGFIDIAGSPINMSGDMNYDILKAIENGANPYFVVAYRNSHRLKENMRLASFFSVNYQTWFPDIVRIYNLLNENLRDVRYSLIMDHHFLAHNVVHVIYENGISFILNYNNHEVEALGHTIEPLSFVRINN